MKTDNRAVWVTWEKQIRNQSMARELGVRLYELVSEKSRIVRYVELTIRTLKTVRQDKPEVLFVQNPSIVLSSLAVLIRPLLGFKLVVDCHNSGLHPLEGRSRTLILIADWIARSADLTIVTNDALAHEVSEKGGNAFVMPDPLPEIATGRRFLDIQNPSLLFICTWARDEPYQEVMEAAKGLEATIYVTGNHKKAFTDEEVAGLPPNVVLLGFVDRKTYDAYLNSVDVVMDLTTRENCLVCGAYEAVSAGKPMIISNTEINQQVFSLGAVYTDNEATSIGDSVRYALLNLDQLKGDVARLARLRLESTKRSILDLRRSVNI